MLSRQTPNLHSPFQSVDHEIRYNFIDNTYIT